MLDNLNFKIATMPGGYRQFYVNNLDDAIKLASYFKKQNLYKYFRGQRNAEWNITSSFSRLNDSDQDLEIKRLVDFTNFVFSSEQLLPYLQNQDAIIATAQHHGLAHTNFIDFSYDPLIASWFSQDGSVKGDFGAIYLVNDEAEIFYKSYHTESNICQFIKIDVSNLWRLQAQKGLFFEIQSDVFKLWPLDRIIYKHQGLNHPLPKTAIYPDKKSILEIAIEQYKTTQQVRKNVKAILSNKSIRHFQVSEENFPLTDNNCIWPKEWEKAPCENWGDVDHRSTPDTFRYSFLFDNCSILLSLIQKRRNCTDLCLIEEFNDEKAQKDLNRLWNGVRVYPYNAQQIASSIKNFIKIHLALTGKKIYLGKDLQDVADQMYKCPVEIEMSISGDSYTRAFVDEQSLWETLNNNAKRRLNFKSYPIKGRKLLHEIANDAKRPWYNFDPEQMIRLFVNQIIPWQIATQRPVVVFSPRQILSLGLP